MSIYSAIVKHMTNAGWSVKEMGQPTQFLSLDLEITTDDEGRCVDILLHQCSAIRHMVERYKLQDLHVSLTPMPKGFEAGPLEGSPSLKPGNSYSSIVGTLLYISTCTRPDVAFAVNYLCRYVSKPSQAHLNAAHRVVSYLNHTKWLGIRYSSQQPEQLVGYSDASYAEGRDRKSHTGVVFMAAGGAVSWNPKSKSLWL